MTNIELFTVTKLNIPLTSMQTMQACNTTRSFKDDIVSLARKHCICWAQIQYPDDDSDIRRVCIMTEMKLRSDNHLAAQQAYLYGHRFITKTFQPSEQPQCLQPGLNISQTTEEL